jgi:hypothetical protein
MSPSTIRTFDATAHRSVLVYGGTESALSALGVSLAHATALPLAWAEFAGASSRIDPSLRPVLERLVLPEGLAAAVPSDLRTVPGGASQASMLFRPDSISPELLQRLDGFLRAPVLFQKLSAEFSDAEGRLAILVSNVDALPRNVLWGTLEDSELHGELHREGITLIATYRGDAPAFLREPFDLVLHVEQPGQRGWRESVVRQEKPVPTRSNAAATPLQSYLTSIPDIGPA